MAKPTKFRKSFIWLLVGLSLGFCVVVGTFLFRHYYHRQLWDPATAALVNDQPIYRSALEAMMRTGLNPGPTERNPRAALTIRQILDRLIDEELVRQEAQKAGLNATEEELTALLAAIQPGWNFPNPVKSPKQQPDQPLDLDQFLQSARLRFQLEKLAQKVIPGQSRPKSQNWRVFWKSWLARMPKSPIYKVQALFVAKGEGVWETLAEAMEKTKGLADLELKIRSRGFITLKSQVMSLNPLDAEARRLLGQERLWEVLAPNGRKTPYLVGPFELPNSWALVETLEVKPTPDPESLALAARRAFELEEGQKAFKAWLAKARSQAKVVINPNILELGLTEREAQGASNPKEGSLKEP
jgi:hypothetical protein